MIHNPSVLVLDEPAAGLDPRARIELREMIGRLAEAGKAILISSHILTELAEVCHKVAIIEQGRLVAVGSVAEISAKAQVRGIVRVKVLQDIERLTNWLTARDGISELKIDGDVAIFSHEGDRASEADLLKAMVAAEIPVIEFGAKHKSLEDVFLHVTEGRVQ
jgi:ABC-2 type transport system ATP-binding protein